MTTLTRDLLAHLDRHRADLRDAVALVPIGDRGRTPAPDRWSVAQVLEHLTIVEGRIAAMFAREARTARSAGKMMTGDGPPVHKLLDTERLLDRTQKIVSSAASAPPGHLDASAALTLLEAEREKFRTFIVSADDLSLEDATFEHARLGALNLYQWVLFAGAHEGRHAAQIREIAAGIAPAEGTRERST